MWWSTVLYVGGQHRCIGLRLMPLTAQGGVAVSLSGQLVKCPNLGDPYHKSR